MAKLKDCQIDCLSSLPLNSNKISNNNSLAWRIIFVVFMHS